MLASRLLLALLASSRGAGPMRIIRRLPVYAVALLLCGCGTMANLDGRRYALMDLSDQVRPRIFGGVANDIRWAPTIILLPDLPVSLVADVVTIPEVLKRQAEWDRKKDAGELHPFPKAAPLVYVPTTPQRPVEPDATPVGDAAPVVDE